MKYHALLAIAFCLILSSVAHARPRRSYSNYPTYSYSEPKAYAYTSEYGAVNDTSTAQGVAEIMARTGRVGHWGGHGGGYEGCGMGSTQQEAYNNCCYARSGMMTVDVGYAQGNNGKWYCCRRYR